MKGSINKPVTKVISKAHRIAKGDYDSSEIVKSDIKEITDLSETINYLSDN